MGDEKFDTSSRGMLTFSCSYRRFEEKFRNTCTRCIVSTDPTLLGSSWEKSETNTNIHTDTQIHRYTDTQRTVKKKREKPLLHDRRKRAKKGILGHSEVSEMTREEFSGTL